MAKYLVEVAKYSMEVSTMEVEADTQTDAAIKAVRQVQEDTGKEVYGWGEDDYEVLSCKIKEE